MNLPVPMNPYLERPVLVFSLNTLNSILVFRSAVLAMYRLLFPICAYQTNFYLVSE